MNGDNATHSVDWALWKRRRRVTIPEALLLSLGIDPIPLGSIDQCSFSPWDCEFFGLPDGFSEQYSARFGFFEEAIADPSTQIYLLGYDRYLDDGIFESMNLTQFARWCADYKLKIPRGLSKLASSKEAVIISPILWEPLWETIPQVLVDRDPEERVVVAKCPADPAYGFRSFTLSTSDLTGTIQEQIRLLADGFYYFPNAAMLLTDLWAGSSLQEVAARMKVAFERNELHVFSSATGLSCVDVSEIVPSCLVNIPEFNLWCSDFGAFHMEKSAPGAETGALTEKPQLKQEWQEARVLDAIRRLGYAPEGLPRNQSGKKGVKKMVRDLINEEYKNDFLGTKFDRAWERLRKQNQICDEQN